MKRFLLVILLLSPASALADGITASTQAIASQIGMLAIDNANLHDQLSQAQQRLIRDEAEIKRLTDKYEPKKEPKP